MTRNLKALGLAVIAVVAIGAVTASSALALTPKLEVGTGDGNLEGTQTEKIIFTFSGGRTVSCETATVTGSLATTSASLTASPVFKSCTSTLAGVTVPTTVLVSNGCDFVFHFGATTATNTYATTMDIVCTAGSSVEFYVFPAGTLPSQHSTVAPLCIFTAGGQAGLSSISALNTPTSSPKDIDATYNLTGIAYTRVIGTIPNCGAASSAATMRGQMTFRGSTTAGAATEAQIVEV